MTRDRSRDRVGQRGEWWLLVLAVGQFDVPLTADRNLSYQ